jgi:hypothetical protein
MVVVRTVRVRTAAVWTVAIRAISGWTVAAWASVASLRTRTPYRLYIALWLRKKSLQ